MNKRDILFLAGIFMLIATGLVNKTNPESVTIIKTNLAKDYKISKGNNPVPYKVKAWI